MTLVAVAEAAAQTPARTLQVDLQSIQINRVPPPPKGTGDYWDGSIVGNLFLGSVTGIYPDIEICLRRGAASQCRRVCVNAQLYEPEEASDPNIKPTVCKIEVDGRLPIARITEVPGGQPAREHFNLDVIVNEFDSTLNNEPRRHMGAFALKPADQPPLLTAPENCTQSQPCKISIPTKNGTFVASFATTVSGVLGTPPRTSTSTSTGGGVPPPPPRPTAPTVDEALRDLRDADNCVGTDEFFPRPQGTVFGRWLRRMIWGESSETDQYYQLAGLVAAIPDPTVRASVQQRVINRVEREGGSETVYLSVVADLESSQAWHEAFKYVGEQFVGKLISKGLDKLLPQSRSLQGDFERWVYKKLATDKLKDEAIDLLFRDSTLTSECVMNELAKRGFREEVGR
jgi:hypothetical protein